jgi:hypothetical protein
LRGGPVSRPLNGCCVCLGKENESDADVLHRRPQVQNELLRFPGGFRAALLLHQRMTGKIARHARS